MADLPLSMKEISLLSFIQGSENEQRLLLSLLAPGLVDPEREYPFAVIDESSRFSRLLEGAFIATNGTVIGKLLLLMQKDCYAASDDSLVSNSNRDVDASWFNALQGANSGTSGEINLVEQIGPSGELVRFSPLFFCRRRKRFFHPLCPSCGSQLHLCTDESLLSGHGLAPYSTSLTRYLYCSDCCSKGQTEFYVYDLGQHDPHKVRDRWGLIDRFALIDSVMDSAGSFPCVGCDGRQDCFGADKAVRSRVIPFAFYPFQMLVRTAPDLHALDYFMLLSGATAGEIAARLDPRRESVRIAAIGRYGEKAACPGSLLPRSDARFFLELLYLKLVFLEKVLEQSVGDGNRTMSPIKIDSIWLHLARVSSPLPESWGFTVSILPEISPPALSLLGGPSTNSTVAPLGLLWFLTLLQNRNISQRELLQSVIEYLSSISSVDKDRKNLVLSTLAVPENIFWQGEGSISGDYLPLWEEAVDIGCRLLDSACRTDISSALQKILAEVVELGGKIRESLLLPQVSTLADTGIPAKSDETATLDDRPRPGVTQSETVPGPDDAAIRQILLRIAARYRQEAACSAVAMGQEKAVPEPATQPFAEDVTEVETIIIGAAGLQAPTESGLKVPLEHCQERVSISSDVNSELSTVSDVIGPDEVDTLITGDSEKKSARESREETDLQETVVIGVASARPPQPAAEMPDDDVIMETVVLSASTAPRQEAVPVSVDRRPPEPSEVDMTETVIVPQGVQRPRPGSNQR